MNCAHSASNRQFSIQAMCYIMHILYIIRYKYDTLAYKIEELPNARINVNNFCPFMIRCLSEFINDEF